MADPERLQQKKSLRKPDWTITIPDPKTSPYFSGFVPAYFENSYPFYGNKNQASAMVNADITDPNVLKPGPGVANLTNGDQTGAVTTLIRSILRYATASNVTYACGGTKYYQLSASTVTNGATYPHTITGQTGIDAESIVYYKSMVYCFYNYTGAGDIMQDNAGTIDDDWGSTVPTGKGALNNAPHPSINGGDNDVYFGNGAYVGAIRDSGALDTQALDFWDNAQVVDLTWNSNRVIIAVNRPNITGSNFNQSGIYYWNGVDSSWSGDPVEVSGRIGALYTKNGVTFCWWQDATDTGAYSFGYVSSGRLNPLKRYSGSLPLYYQVGEYKGFIAWVSNGLLCLWGSKDPDIPVDFFQYTQPKYTTAGGIASPFGDLLMASYTGSTYSLAKPSGYVTNFSWKTRAFQTGFPGYVSQIETIEIEYEQLSSGAILNTTLTYDKGKSTLALDQVAYSADNITRQKILTQGPQTEDFRLDFDNTGGSTSNPVKIRQILIRGYYIKKN